MRVVWDPRKEASNLRKHGVWFADAEGVLSDSAAVTREDVTAIGEQRFISVGRDYVERLTVVVYTHRGDDIRIISARPATPAERRAYEEGV